MYVRLALEFADLLPLLLAIAPRVLHRRSIKRRTYSSSSRFRERERDTHTLSLTHSLALSLSLLSLLSLAPPPPPPPLHPLLLYKCVSQPPFVYRRTGAALGSQGAAAASSWSRTSADPPAVSCQKKKVKDLITMHSTKHDM